MERSRAVGRASRRSGRKLLFQGAAFIVGRRAADSGSSGPGNSNVTRRIGGGPSPVSSSSSREGGRRVPVGVGPRPHLPTTGGGAAFTGGPEDTSTMTEVGATWGAFVGGAARGPVAADPGLFPLALRGGLRSLVAFLRIPLWRVSMRWAALGASNSSSSLRPPLLTTSIWTAGSRR